VSEERVQAIVSEGYTRDQVIAALGPADARNDETRALGFQRCFDSHGHYVGVLFVLIYPTLPLYVEKDHVTECELIAVQFDVNGRAVGAYQRVVSNEQPKVSLSFPEPPPPFQPRTLMCEMLGSSGQCILAADKLRVARSELSFSVPHCEENVCTSARDEYWLYGYYANGVELVDRNEPHDYVEAYKMLSIVVAMATDAALASDATKVLDALAAKMDAAQIAEAQRLANEWTAAFEKRQPEK
jgi:hypothetical protein